MFNLFKSDPSKKLQKAYEAKLEQAMQSQRNGDIRRYSELSAEADVIYKQLQALKAE
ncbi:DUF6435 family protein [Marinimicrobium alkaliphilum]|uniref:DUF6435 family protein n=1 Tax=Marinimicrobium alkaliphilum TaxID=2202654 RepID=UPI000DBA86DF|nr:DUF6435 family protein [Marinimicrobium alkaliphilum]